MMCAEPPLDSGVISVYRSRVGIPVHGSLTVNCSPPDFLHCMYIYSCTYPLEGDPGNYIHHMYTSTHSMQSVADLEI